MSPRPSVSFSKKCRSCQHVSKFTGSAGPEPGELRSPSPADTGHRAGPPGVARPRPEVCFPAELLQEPPAQCHARSAAPASEDSAPREREDAPALGVSVTRSQAAPRPADLC